jgi:hypothetical protein
MNKEKELMDLIRKNPFLLLNDHENNYLKQYNNYINKYNDIYPDYFEILKNKYFSNNNINYIQNNIIKNIYCMTGNKYIIPK